MIDFFKDNATIISLIIAVTALVQPWFIALWKKFFRSPKIEIYPSGSLEIGYSDYGTTIGLHGTLRAPHGDVFVKSLRLQLTEQDVKGLRGNAIVMTENHFRIAAGEQLLRFHFAYPSIIKS